MTIAFAVACAAPEMAVPRPAEELRVEVIGERPHDPAAFTEGLALADGRLYESTGSTGVVAARGRSRVGRHRSLRGARRAVFRRGHRHRRRSRRPVDLEGANCTRLSAERFRASSRTRIRARAGGCVTTALGWSCPTAQTGCTSAIGRRSRSWVMPVSVHERTRGHAQRAGVRGREGLRERVSDRNHRQIDPTNGAVTAVIDAAELPEISGAWAS